MSRDRADGVRKAWPLFQAAGSGEIPTSALQLRIDKIEFSLAKQLNSLWHSRLPRLTSPQCRVAYGAEFGGNYYAVAVWSRPIAMNNPQYEWMELQRFAIATDAPKNTATRLLGLMARFIRRDYPDITRLISYQDCDVHKGTIYRAAGWQPTVTSTGEDWNRPSRCRRKAQSTAVKQRWEKHL